MIGWTRWNRLTGSDRYPMEASRVVLSVEPILGPPYRGKGPNHPVRWEVLVLVKDPTVPLGATLVPVAAGEEPNADAGREAAEDAYRATDAATRAGTSVVDSHMTEREQGHTAPRGSERTAQEVQQ
jgi:hypothetical protein